MGAFGDPCDSSPLTNRGVEVTDATFCGARTSSKASTHSPKKGPWARGCSSRD